jgi:uncharacterized membrane protein
MKVSLLKFSLISFILMNIFIFIKKYFDQEKIKVEDESLRQYKKKVKKERMDIFLISSVISIIIVFLLKKLFKLKLSNIKCLGLITLILEMVYRLYPKKHWMVLELDNKEDRKRWVNGYKCISNLAVFADILSVIILLL